MRRSTSTRAGSDEDEDSDGGGVCEGLLDPEEVRENWRRLRTVSFERYFDAYRETPQGKGCNDPDIDDHLRDHFTTLVEVYRCAADAGAGMKFTVW
ncbi:hypothetical protein [Phytomonospora endophytica]|uniref:Uncharacterized protein n=1 Tax=Phytomonospora endophytica TaxID=714109 RepID=A0A841FHN7_9ACTN|nr:hypothetical protein [Phytomonospora endophytica]MBB6032179.1 hypothetical protein [Phytomonospora endophytica]GIG68528.1 hypothetical protein Pen01_48230 [Phytomonospora endophytica]